ncbi:MAG: ATP-binding protein [Holosporales bacterium]|jgi:signal transduction histidine kinase
MVIINPRIIAIKLLVRRLLAGCGALIAGTSMAHAAEVLDLAKLANTAVNISGVQVPLPLLALGLGIVIVLMGVLFGGGNKPRQKKQPKRVPLPELDLKPGVEWDIAPEELPKAKQKSKSKSLFSSRDDREQLDFSSYEFTDTPRHFDRVAGQLKILVDKLPVPAWIRDAKLELIFVNKAFSEAVNLTTSDVLHRQTELAAGAISDNGRALARLAQMHDSTLTESHSIIVAGKPRLFEITESAIIDGSGVVGFARDYSAIEELRTEFERVLESQHIILNQIDMGVAIYSAERRLIYYNDAFMRLWGLKDDFLVKLPTYTEVLQALRQTRLLPDVRDVDSWLRQENEIFQTLVEARRDWLHLRDQRSIEVVAQTHPQGGLLFTYRDRTQQAALAPTATHEVDLLPAAVLENLDEAVAVFGADQNIRLCNAAFRKFWRLDNRAAETLTVTAFFSQIARQLRFPGSDAVFRQEFGSRKASQGSLALNDKRLVDYVISPLFDGAVMLAFKDVSDIARQQEELRTRERQKSEHLVHVSRALVDPLQAILGFSEMIPGAGHVSDKQHQYLGYISEAAKRLQEYVADALDIAAIDAGYRTIQRKPVRLDSLLRSVAEMLRADAEAKGLRWQVNFSPDVAMGNVDEQRLRQIISNVLSNAVKFTAFGGSVTLKAQRNGGMVDITIIDTGAGMTAEQLARARGELPLSGEYGLGLQLARQNIEMHGGSIEFISTPKQGTLVTIHLPC